MRKRPAFYTRTLALIGLLSCYFNGMGQSYNRATASTYFQVQDFDDAIQYLKSIEETNSGTATFNTDLGYSFYMNEQYAEAKAYFQKAFFLQPGNFEPALYLAQLYYTLDNRDSSLFYYETVIKMKPDNFRYWQRAGNICYQSAKFDSAWNFYSTAYRLNNKSGRIAVALVNLLVRNRKINEADSLLSEFLVRDTADEDVLAKKIEISFKKTSYDTVIFWGEKLWRDSSLLSSPFVSLAYSYLNKQQYEKCLQLCDWLEVKNKASEAILYCEALACSKSGFYKKSNEKLDECIKLSIRDDAHTYLQAKADNFEGLKDFSSAARYYDTAWFIFQNPYDLYFAGRVYDKFLGNIPKAKYYYRLFKKNKPVPLGSSDERIAAYVVEYLRPKQKKDN